MFGRVSSNKNQQTEAKDENIRKESQLEEDLGSVMPAGNEAAQEFLPLAMLIGNNAFDGLIEDQPEDDHIHKGRSKHKKLDLTLSNSWMDEVLGKDDGEPDQKNADDFDEDDPHRDRPKPSGGIKKADLTLSNSWMDEVLGEDDEDHPVQEEKEKEPDDLEEYNDYALEEDMRPSAALKNNVKNRRNKTRKKKGAKARRLGQNEINGLEEAEQEQWKGQAMERLQQVRASDDQADKKKALYAEEMEKIKNWDFHAQKLDEVKSPSKLRRILTYAALGAGKLFGYAVNVLTLGKFWRALSFFRAGGKSKNSWQQERDHQTIPGWDGAKYDPDAKKGEDVMADFRRVPTVWSHLTAAKAADKVEKNGKETEKPLDPVVSVLIDQPKSGSTQTMNGSEMGHVMLGIEYSRKSLVTNRYERYKLQYGFYPRTSVLKTSTSAVMMKDNAVVPGELADDYAHEYDVSRSYPAKPSQVNAIFRASEKYADGGYGFYDRNCATFVKEMIVNKARLATGGDIFKQSDVQFSHLANAVMMAAAASEENTKAGTENILMDLSEQDADTYENYGNKKAAYSDWKNYKRSMRSGSSWTKQTYVPGQIAEHMRRMEGEGTGEIGSRKFSEGLKDKEGRFVMGLSHLSSAIENQVNRFEMKMENVIPAEQMQHAPMELAKILGELDAAALPITSLETTVQNNLDKYNEDKEEEDKLNWGSIKVKDFIPPDELLDSRQKLSESVSRINLLLNNYLKNDKRVHHDLMNLISLLNYGIIYLDEIYADTVRGGKSDGENPDNIREEMTQMKYTVKAGGREAEFTPTHYESYIQIYKDPEIAVAKYKRLQELREKRDAQGAWTGKGKPVIALHNVKSHFGVEKKGEMSYDEYVELKKLETMDKLARQFDNAHNYMLEKDQYSQQDIDYAFRLNYREKNGDRKERHNHDHEIGEEVDFRDDYKSASGIYIALILDKIFHGLREAWMKAPEEDGLSLENMRKSGPAFEWIDDFFVDHVKSKKDEFQMIIRGLTRAMKTADPAGNVSYEKLRSKLSEMFIKILVGRNFKSEGFNERELLGNKYLNNYLLSVGYENSFKFTGILNKMIAACLKESRDLPKDRMD